MLQILAKLLAKYNITNINTSLQKSEKQTKLEQVLIFQLLIYMNGTEEKMRHVFQLIMTKQDYLTT